MINKTQKCKTGNKLIYCREPLNCLLVFGRKCVCLYDMHCETKYKKSLSHMKFMHKHNGQQEI